MIRVLVADDHAIVRRGLVQILSETDDNTVVGEAGGYLEIRRALAAAPCDVLVLDINMPGKNGIDILKQLKGEMPRLEVLMLSMYPEEQYAVRALKAGAAGYLNKASAAERLIEAIRQVASGRKYVSMETAQALVESLAGEVSELPHVSLSDREFETLRLIARGKRLSEIAQTLALSPKTVSVYRARVLQKMRLGTNAELAAYALRHGLID
jgi:two-component system invasion response regulator UvrY